jgi:hypothetical protein
VIRNSTLLKTNTFLTVTVSERDAMKAKTKELENQNKQLEEKNRQLEKRIAAADFLSRGLAWTSWRGRATNDRPTGRKMAGSPAGSHPFPTSRAPPLPEAGTVGRERKHDARAERAAQIRPRLPDELLPFRDMIVPFKEDLTSSITQRLDRLNHRSRVRPAKGPLTDGDVVKFFDYLDHTIEQSMKIILKFDVTHVSDWDNYIKNPGMRPYYLRERIGTELSNAFFCSEERQEETQRQCIRF